MTDTPETVERVYSWNGNTFPISSPHLTDTQVAGMVRMLMREQLNHEHICVLARDRIMCLTAELAEALTAAQPSVEDATHWAATSASGLHIGLWDDVRIARNAVADMEGVTITALRALSGGKSDE